MSRAVPSMIAQYAEANLVISWSNIGPCVYLQTYWLVCVILQDRSNNLKCFHVNTASSLSFAWRPATQRSRNKRLNWMRWVTRTRSFSAHLSTSLSVCVLPRGLSNKERLLWLATCSCLPLLSSQRATAFNNQSTLYWIHIHEFESLRGRRNISTLFLSRAFWLAYK